MVVNHPGLRWVVGSRPRRTFVRAAVLAAASFILFGSILRPFRVQGVSMEPTIRDGSFRFGWLTAYLFREPRAGDVVMIRMAGRSMMYLKRILAVPGESARFESGQLWVDGASRPEPYVKRAGDWTAVEIRLGPDEYLVAGDNRGTPMELHAAGVTTRDRIVGRLAW